MPPRRKVVKRTVRKAAPKSKKSTSSITPPPPPSATDADNDNDTPLPDAATTTDPEPTVSEASVPEEAPAVEPFAGEEAAQVEEQPAADEAALAEEQPVADEAPVEEEPAVDEDPAYEPPAELETAGDVEEATAEEQYAADEAPGEELRSELVTAGDAEEATAEEPKNAEENETKRSDTAPSKKIVKRVRKVVKKRIVVKKVPKASIAAAKDVVNVGNEEAVASTAPAEEKSCPNKDSPIPESSERREPENPSSDAAADVGPETEKMETEGTEDAPMEEDKADGGDAEDAAASAVGDEERGISERRRRRKTEIFIGGLDRDAKEDDIRKVFGSAGEIIEVRMMMDGQSGKNKGFCFLRYAEAAQAKKAVAEFNKVEICGKLCGAAALEGNDTIFLGSIDKKWKKEDVVKLLEEIGIEKIDTVTVMADPKDAELNRGFAFLELETNRDAQIAYKKLQKKDAFGKGRNVKVAWAEPLNDPDEEEMQKVKSVYVEGIPLNWDEEKMRETFKKFGEIDRVVLARNMRAARRKDFAFVNYATRESALSCVELFDKEDLTDNGSKVNLKVSLAKPVQKGKQNKGGLKSNNNDNLREKPKAVFQRDMKAGFPPSNGKPFKAGYSAIGEDVVSSKPHGLMQVFRHQTAWNEQQAGYARVPTVQDYAHAFYGEKRNFSAMGDNSMYSDLRGYPRARLESSYSSAGSSYGTVPHGMAGPSLPYYQQPNVGYAPGNIYGATDQSSNLQMRQGPYESGPYPRY